MLVKKLMILICASVCAAQFTCLDGQAQQTGYQTVAELQQSPAGSKIIRLVEHINSNSESTEAVINSVFASSLVEKHGVKKLQSLIADVRENDGQLEVYDANRVEVFMYELKAKGTSHGEWLDIALRLEEQDPYKISAIEGINISQHGAKAEKPMITPGSVVEIKRRQPSVTKEAIEELEKWLVDRTDAGEFSGVVLLAKDFEPIYEKAFGLASKRFNVPVELDTKFRLASVNKVFTSTAILQLIEQGKLSFDDKLVDYVDGFSDPRASQVTIKHLLSHSSGWAAYWSHPEYLENQHLLRTVSDYMKFIKKINLDFTPGERMQYSNTGYNILGAVIEEVSGMSYYEYMQKNIFEPAGMNSTASLQIDHVAEGLATGYTNYNHLQERVGKGYPFENTFLSSRRGTPAGGGCSTANDLLKFVAAVANHKLVNEDSVLFLRRDSGVRNQPGPFIFHNGGGPGQSAWMQADVENGYSLIVLCNLDSPAGTAVVKKIGELLSLPTW